ncbi:IAP_a [Tipula oleracea nudivirus]|uniref:IAP_a n=1 Tax=Tipula oleracea nudivirus TaxID=1546257 RepID=A0A0B4VGE1_9VIRU|nr:IAP_a [Tipula oleracea nudivirus]AJD20146.1 IAP_a [Tipula oleracea nudivirus]
MSELQNNIDNFEIPFEIPLQLPEVVSTPITPLSTYFRNPSPPIAPRKRNKRRHVVDFILGNDEPRNTIPRRSTTFTTSTTTQNLLNTPTTPTNDVDQDQVRRVLTYGDVIHINDRQNSFLNDETDEDINNLERSIRDLDSQLDLHFSNFSNALARLTRSPPPSPPLSFSPSPSPTPERSSLYDDFHAYDEPRFVEEALSVSISPPPPPPTPAKEIKDAIIPPSIANITCKICMENETCILIEPCYHACLCFPCSIHIGDKCPICRGVISKRRRIYFS